MSAYGNSIDAETIRAEAAIRLIGRRDCEEWSEKDQAELETWLAETPANRIAYIRLEAAWRRADRLVAMQPPNTEPSKSVRAWAIRIAIGAVVMAAALSGVFAYITRPQIEFYATALGGHETITLSDGSHIELNTDTALRTTLYRNARLVWIDKGEAYFRIRHNAAHPFIVNAGSGQVTDLGTEFFVRREAGRVEISLLEGRARFDSVGRSRSQSTDLVPGDELVATENSVSKLRAKTDELAHSLSWRNGLLVFDNLPLSDVAASFNRYNREKLVVAGADVARMTVVGTFRTDGVARFAHVAHDILGLQITREGNEIIISR
jgi:transmembrane sensor